MAGFVPRLAPATESAMLLANWMAMFSGFIIGLACAALIFGGR